MAIILGLLLVWFPLGVGAATLAADQPTVDISGQFMAALESVRNGSNRLPPEAKGYTYLFFNGLLANRYPGYGAANVKRLKDLELDASLVPIDSEASVLHGAETVRQAVLGSFPAPASHKYVLIGHSKGAVDIAAALAIYPELKDHVRVFIAIQTPFRGSPMATELEDSDWRRKLVEAGVPLFFGGDPNAFFDLSYKRRKLFLEKYPFPAEVPTISLASSRLEINSIMNLPAQHIWDRYGLKSDGMVVPEDAVFPGSRLIRVEDMDHAETILVGIPGFRRYAPGEVTEALVTLALRP